MEEYDDLDEDEFERSIFRNMGDKDKAKVEFYKFMSSIQKKYL